MFGLMFSSYVILISPIKFFSIMINHPKEIVSKIKDNLYLAVFTIIGDFYYARIGYLYINLIIQHYFLPKKEIS